MKPDDRIPAAISELAAIAMCMIALEVVLEVKPKGVSGAIFQYCLVIFIAIVITIRAICVTLPKGAPVRVADRLWRIPAEGGVRYLVDLAGVIAGTRRAHLVDAWRADLFGDPDGGEMPSMARRLGLAGGDVIAAFRCRFDDLAALAWGHADRLLASWHGSRAAVVVPVVLAVVVVVSREGFYALVANAENLGCIGTGSFLAVKGLRGYRGISAPKRPQKKKSVSADQESVPRSGV